MFVIYLNRGFRRDGGLSSPRDPSERIFTKYIRNYLTKSNCYVDNKIYVSQFVWNTRNVYTIFILMNISGIYGRAAAEMTIRIRHAIFVLGIFSWVAVSLSARAGSGEFTGRIVLGATFPLTGGFETYGQSAYYGAATAVKLINAAGGVNGKELVIEWRDNRSDPEQSARDIEELTEKFKAPAILGPLLSESCMAIRPLAEKLKVVIMSPLATIDAATRDTEWIFRACFTNSAEANGLIAFQMNSYGAKSCGVIFDSAYAFSVELADIFAERFQKQGGRMVGIYSLRAAGGEKDYATPLKALATEAPDFIFAPCYALEATEVIRAARELGIATRFCGSDTWDNEMVFDASGTRLAGTSFASSLFEQAFSYRPFQTFFTAMEQAGMDNPDAQAACAYDAVYILARALEKGETPEAIRQGLTEVKRLPLATGRITILPSGDTLKSVLVRVVERRGGRLIPVYGERYDP